MHEGFYLLPNGDKYQYDHQDTKNDDFRFYYTLRLDDSEVSIGYEKRGYLNPDDLFHNLRKCTISLFRSLNLDTEKMITMIQSLGSQYESLSGPYADGGTNAISILYFNNNTGVYNRVLLGSTDVINESKYTKELLSVFGPEFLNDLFYEGELILDHYKNLPPAPIKIRIKRIMFKVKRCLRSLRRN
jgi:hypothetical protein